MCQSYLESNEGMEPTENKHVVLSDQDHVGSSTLQPVNPEQGSTQQDVSSSRDTPFTSPALTSSDSFVSNYSDYSVVLGPNEGLKPEEGEIESGHRDPNSKPPNESVNGSSLLTSENALRQSDDLKVNQHKRSNGTVHENLDIQDNDDESESAILGETDENSTAYDDQHDIWLPPEVEDEHDDMENSMAALDEEDDECGDGDASEWTMPSSLSNFEEDILSSHRSKEDKQKAIEEVMNGKFRNLVNELLRKVGVENCDWADTVTLLAWQAASFVKPEAADGKAMDPAGYVKIKCVAAGSRGDSRVIKGLVFKKHAALKQMATKYKKPRLLLVQGGLEPSSVSSGLSSFRSLMVEDKDNLTDLVENLQACQPNVILVEKSASRDMLKKVVDLDLTLVLDMKLHRLERVARCTGSPILSSDKPFSKKLKQCESLYFEKIVEEHAIVGEGGKKPCKTLMFLEGCPTRLGCTILLTGSHSEELKKIKCVVQCAVVMAYHFLLETSFLVDQEAMFSTIAYQNVVDNFPGDEKSISISSEISFIHNIKNPNAKVEVPISNGGDVRSTRVKMPNGDNFGETSHVEEVSTEIVPSNDHHEEISDNMQPLTSDPSTVVCNEPHMTPLSTQSSSLDDVLEKVSFVSPTTYEDMSTYIDLNEAGPRLRSTVSIPFPPSEEPPEEHDAEDKNSDKDEASPDNGLHSVSSLSVDIGEAKGAVDDGEDAIRPKDDISNLLDSESILVLMSSRNAAKGTHCEQSHFSHIKFYRHFDVPLGKFLRDNLFTQTVSCKTCNEPPEAHFYYYAHHSKQLTIKVKRLGGKARLPGESEGKLWMWSRCGKCPPSKEKATKRVLISKAARGLSFGKFLELSFSSLSSFNRLSSCGHSFQKDFLYFFGLGSKVAMFRYSRVATYTVSVPSQKLEFNNSINGDWLQKEIEMVRTKGLLLFSEVGKYLNKLESRFSGQNLALAVNASLNKFSDIVDMLKLEKSGFEENIKNTSIKGQNSYNTVHKLLSLNRIRWEILLEACVWDRRLQSLNSSLSSMPQSTVTNDVAKAQAQAQVHAQSQAQTQAKLDSSDSGSSREEAQGSQAAVLEGMQGQPLLKENLSDEVEGTHRLTEEAVKEQCDTPNTHSQGQTILKVNVSQSEHKSSDITNVEVHIKEGEVAEVSLQKCPSERSIQEHLESQTSRELVASVSPLHEPDLSEGRSIPIEGDDFKEACEEAIPPAVSKPDCEVEDRRIPIEGDDFKEVSEEAIPPAVSKPDCEVEDRRIPIEGNATKEVSEKVISPTLPKPDSKVSEWNPFSEIVDECKEDLHEGCRPKFGHLPIFLLLQSPIFLPELSEVILEEASRLHIPLRDGDYIVSDFDGEISSSVACALAVMNDRTPRAFDSDENGDLKRTISAPSVSRTSSGYLGQDVIQSSTSITFLDNFANVNNLDYSISNGEIHPEVTLGVGKYPTRGKSSVIIIHANEFRTFREQCCPSEIDYIASLSRCKIWDAKGGKSKSLFAKTNDDRLIIKEIKKTEYDSFMKFATGYFRHMKDSVQSGNQTCLAKILGIYQVTIRNPKSGKELKHDLMVMENLSFGRNITRQYDLKGALHARFTAGDGTDDVLLDQNFVNDMNASPLYVGKRAKRLLQRAVWNDTTFLHNINVMDYSLLVGVDRKGRELLCGIIDYLRQYTWDKQLETWVKSSLKNVTPTIVSPETYKKRFRKFMDTHFLTVPDHWCSQRSSNPCKLCGINTVDSLHTTERPQDLNA